MKKILLVLIAAAFALPDASALANESKPRAKFRNTDIKRSLFSGNEAPLNAIGGLRVDCTIPIADVRIISPAKHGKVRFEETKTVVTANKSAVQKLCHGKKVDAVVPYYKADEKFAGQDQFVVEVDTKIGVVWRYTYILTVSGNSDAKKAAAEVTKPLQTMNLNRDVFSGNEVRIAAMNYVNADCSSGPIPDLRIVTTPQNGEIRQEETVIPVSRPPGDPRSTCNGKPVSAVAVFYKSKADFTGKDNVVIDVDFKTGTVRRFSYQINAR